MRVLNSSPTSQSEESYSIQDSEGKQEWLEDEGESKEFFLQEKWSQKASRYSDRINSVNGWEHERDLEFEGDADQLLKDALDESNRLLEHVEPASRREALLNEIEERAIEHAAEEGMLDDGVIDEHEAQELSQFIEEQVMLIEIDFDPETPELEELDETDELDEASEELEEDSLSGLKFNKEFSKIVEGVRQGHEDADEYFDNLPEHEVGTDGQTVKEKMAQELISYFDEGADIYDDASHELPSALTGFYASLSPENKQIFDDALNEASNDAPGISLQMTDEELEDIISGESLNSYGEPWSQVDKETAEFLLSRRGSAAEGYHSRVTVVNFAGEALETA